MLKVTESPEDLPVPPECRATVEQIQRALDGVAETETLADDPHSVVCAACRERIRAARVLMSVLATPPEPVAVPAGFADRVLAAVAADRQAEPPRGYTRAARVTGWAALAAAIIVGMFYLAARQHPTSNTLVPGPVETAKPTEIAPAPREKPTPAPVPNPAPAPRPIRIGDEFAKAGQAILDAPNPLAESVAVAPKIFDAFTDPFKNSGAQPDPMATAIEPARKSIADLPVAARSGLEPVTGTAEKAFNRFLRDMGAVKPNS